MGLHQSGEDYLEAILVLEQKNGAVRAIDVARHLEYSKPSVSRAMGLLRADGFLMVDESGLLHLTENGRSIAESVYERHSFLVKWLIRLGVSEKTAAEDACKLEHGLSEETFSKLKEYIRETEG